MVVVAMSGGVDSSVAAALLVEQGYPVVGMMLRLWSEEGHEGREPLLHAGCDGPGPPGGSDAGDSILCAGCARALSRQRGAVLPGWIHARPDA